MFRLTRQVRFAVNAAPDDQLAGRPSNAYGGFPSLTGLGHYFELELTLAGEPDPVSQYVRNIVEIDREVRRLAVPRVERHVRERTFGGGAGVAAELFGLLAGAWPGARLTNLKLKLTPFLAYSIDALDGAFNPERPMVRLSQRFEFSASHRLHNPACSDDENRSTFGKCNNPHGHGHNYEVQVTVAGEPDADGRVVDVVAFERAVAKAAIDKLDHKNLNVEVPEFAAAIPSVENIARAIYGMLKPRFPGPRGRLVSVTVWETPKTWCEYTE